MLVLENHPNDTVRGVGTRFHFISMSSSVREEFLNLWQGTTESGGISFTCAETESERREEK